MTSIRTVSSCAGLKRFIRYPFAKYRQHPPWVPPLLISEREKFDPKKNPFYEHAWVDLFLAERSGEVVGRVAAIDDDNHNQTHGDNLVFFGFFEAEEDQEAAQALLARVEDWGRRLGRDSVRGPANPSMNDGAGLQIDAFDTDPYVMMPYNPPECPRYIEAVGYGKIKDLYAWLFDASLRMSDKVERLAERVRKRYDPVIRPGSMKRFEEELAILKRIYNEAGERNGRFGRYTEAEFDRLARELKLIIDPDVALFLELDGQVAGVAIGLPDVKQVLKRMRGRLLPFGIFQFLDRKKIIDQKRLPILGLMPEYRNKGLDLLLIHEIYKRGTAKGYKRGELSWVLEDNKAMNHAIEASGATLYKTYRMYQKAI